MSARSIYIFITKIYILFVMPHLEYNEWIYGPECNTTLHQKFQSIQFNVTFATT